MNLMKEAHALKRAVEDATQDFHKNTGFVPMIELTVTTQRVSSCMVEQVVSIRCNVTINLNAND